MNLKKELLVDRMSKLSKVQRLPSIIKLHKSTINESLIALLICAIGDLCAGIILGNMTFFLKTFPGLLVLIPGAIGMRGNIFGSFASRLSTNLHIGTLEPEFKSSSILNTNLASSVILTMILSLFLAVFAKFMCIIFSLESISLMDFILISVFAGLISSLIMLPLAVFISFKSFIGGWDPDNVTTPIVAAFGDLLTLPCIILALFILELLNVNLLIKTVVFIILIIIVLGLFIYGLYSDDYLKTILKESTPILLFCSFLGTFAGTVLDSCASTLLNNPTILTLVPLFSGESGNLVSILGARLSSGIHSGLIEAEFKLNETVTSNFIIVALLSLIVYPSIAIIADLSSMLLNIKGFSILHLILISLLSGMVLIPIMMVIVFFIGIYSFNKSLDPDNVVIPISTSITDALSNSLLIVFSLIVISFML